MNFLAGKIDAQICRCIKQGFFNFISAVFADRQTDIRAEKGEGIADLIPDHGSDRGIALQMKVTSMPLAVGKNMLFHFRINQKHVAGKVYKYFSGIGRLKPVVNPRKKPGTKHILCIAEAAGKCRLCQIKTLRSFAEAFFINNGDNIAEKLRIQANLRSTVIGLPGFLGISL